MPSSAALIAKALNSADSNAPRQRKQVSANSSQQAGESSLHIAGLLPPQPSLALWQGPAHLCEGSSPASPQDAVSG